MAVRDSLSWRGNHFVANRYRWRGCRLFVLGLQRFDAGPSSLTSLCLLSPPLGDVE